MKIPKPNVDGVSGRLPGLGRLGSRAGRITSAGRGRTGPEAGGAARHPVISRVALVFLVVGVAAAAVLYDRVEGVRSDEANRGAEQTFVTPSVTDPSSLDGAWFCPMGSSNPEGFAAHTVHISNLSETPLVANLIVLTGQSSTTELLIRYEVAPLSTRSVPLSEIVQSDPAGAVVEIIGGIGVVGHSVETASGTAEGPCSTHVSSTWYFAAGRTTRDSHQYLALMNPFPEDVRYSVELYRSAGRARKPAALTGQEVPANSVRVIDIGVWVGREDTVAAAVTTDRGRLVVERLMTINGDLGPSGASLQLGVVQPADSWMLPAGRIHDGGGDRVVVFNPSPDQTATVDIELWPLNPTDRSLYGLGAIPRELRPGRFEVIDLRTEADQYGIRLPYEVGVSVSSTNDVPVVAERWQFAKQVDTSLIGAGGSAVTPGQPTDPGTGQPVPNPEDPAAGGDDAGDVDVPGILGAEAQTLTQPTANVGIGTSRGTEVLSNRWVIPWVSTPAENASVVVVTSPTDAQVQVRVLLNGELRPALEASVPAGGRSLVTLPPGAPGGPVLVTSSAPVSVEAQVVVPDSRMSTVAAVPTVVP
ncbi:MAG: hypothetical protein R2761_27160 [Acidimicrobiales bacterium]